MSAVNLLGFSWLDLIEVAVIRLMDRHLGTDLKVPADLGGAILPDLLTFLAFLDGYHVGLQFQHRTRHLVRIQSSSPCGSSEQEAEKRADTKVIGLPIKFILQLLLGHRLAHICA